MSESLNKKIGEAVRSIDRTKLRMLVDPEIMRIIKQDELSDDEIRRLRLYKLLLIGDKGPNRKYSQNVLAKRFLKTDLKNIYYYRWSPFLEYIGE